MGLYDRDYMREKPVRDTDDRVGGNCRKSWRRWPVVLGVVLVLAALIAFLVVN